MVELAPISIDDALEYFESHSKYRGPFNLAIAAREQVITLERAVQKIQELERIIKDIQNGVMQQTTLHGVIGMLHDGNEYALGHISTDASAYVGSLLYGGSWRAAKAIGYKTITI